ncbi:MAG: hypothetical protein AAF363_14770 [Bacteroidota bacterium]
MAILGFSKHLATAKSGVPIGKVEKIEVVAELPNTEDYAFDEADKTYLDLARLHEEFNIAWVIPVWIIREPILVLAKKDSDVYYELTEEQLEGVLIANQLDKEASLKLGFYTSYGGKLILLLILGIALYGIFSKDEEEDVKPQNI